MEGEQEKREGRVEIVNASDEDKWVHDASVDYKGNLPLRRSTGVWKASFFIIAIEFCERFTYFGISSNLISYLIKVVHEDLKTAAKSVNYWSGVTTLMPLLGGFLADAYTGRFIMVLLASLIYLMGLCLMTMSQFIPALEPCNKDFCDKPRKVHEVVFFIAIYCLSLGTGGNKPGLESLGADQFDDNNAEERKKKMSFFNLWSAALCSGLIFSVTFLVYVQDNVSWGVANLILTILMAGAILTFYLGRPYYRYRIPEGSPLTPMIQVLVASIRKRNLPLPSNPDLLYEAPKSLNSRARLLGHTNRLRFLDKAAIIGNEDISNGMDQNPWRLTTVTRVEELKLLLNIIPIWLTALAYGICGAQGSTFFIKQAASMNRKIGNHFEIPAATTYGLAAVGMIISVTIYEKILVPVFRKLTGNERGIGLLKRIGIGLVFLILAMSTAALVEMKRLKLAKEEIKLHGDSENVVPSMSVFWLTPQYLIWGLGDGFTIVGLQELFYDQVPDSMRSLGIAFYLSVLGVGSFLSSFLITIADHVSRSGGGKSWFGKDMNSSRVDNFYWLLTAFTTLDLCVYVWLAKRYTYKVVQPNSNMVVVESSKDDNLKLVA